MPEKTHKLLGIVDYDPSGRDEVDKRGNKRVVPMEVLVLGLPRTGTASMFKALQKLGYRGIYHMVQALANPKDFDLWNEAIDAKWYGKGKPYEREDWDQLLGDCMAVLDFPCSAFAPELVAAYPEARVILTGRSPESWAKSIQSTIGKLITASRFDVVAFLDPHFLGKSIVSNRRLWMAYFGAPSIETDVLIRRYNEHCEEVKSLVPTENLLEFQIGDSWEPLCRFLGKDVPDEPYPRVNESRDFASSTRERVVRRLTFLLKRWLMWISPAVIVAIVALTAKYGGWL